MKTFISLFIGLLLSPYVFSQRPDSIVQAEIDAINEMPLWIAYLMPLDSLGEVMNDEFMDFNQVHSYKFMGDGQIGNAFPLLTVYFDKDNKIRKTFKRWADGGALHSVVYYDSSGQLVYGIYNKGGENYGRLYAHTFRCDWEMEVFPATECIEKQYGVVLEKPRHAPRTRFVPQPGDNAVLCSPYVYSSPRGEKSTEGRDGTCISFGMPVVVSALIGDWCKISSVFNAPLGYVPMRDVEIVK